MVQDFQSVLRLLENKTQQFDQSIMSGESMREVPIKITKTLDELDVTTLKLNGKDMSKKPWRCPGCSHLRIDNCLHEECPARWEWGYPMPHINCGGMPITEGTYTKRCWCNPPYDRP